MLKLFEVTNFKGFEDKFTMNLSQTKSYEFNNQCIKSNISRFAQCYGPNASGKSNLGIAILDIVAHLTDLSPNKTHYGNYLNAESPLLAAQFKYIFQFEQTTVTYEYSKTDLLTPIKESLWINDDLVISLDRTSDAPPMVSLAGAESLLLDDIKSNKISIVKFVARNSILAKNKTNDAFSKFLDLVDHMLYFRSLQDTSFIGFKSGTDSILDYVVKNNLLQDFENFLSDLGIKYKLIPIDEPDSEKSSIAVKFKDRTKGFWEIASTGTRALSIFYYWYTKIKNQPHSSLVFIDEFDAFYHFKLSEKITKMLVNLEQHQFILTTHNTGLLSNEIARPDCNFIIDKHSMNPLYALTEKELRSAHNIEKIYRAGGFNE
jgi:AAA15 family ATPase/GTPase